MYKMRKLPGVKTAEKTEDKILSKAKIIMTCFMLMVRRVIKNTRFFSIIKRKQALPIIFCCNYWQVMITIILTLRRLTLEALSNNDYLIVL